MLLGSGQVSHIYVWKISLKIPNFSIFFFLGQKKPNRVGSKTGRPLIYCSSKVQKYAQGPSLVFIHVNKDSWKRKIFQISSFFDTRKSAESLNLDLCSKVIFFWLIYCGNWSKKFQKKHMLEQMTLRSTAWSPENMKKGQCLWLLPDPTPKNTFGPNLTLKIKVKINFTYLLVMGPGSKFLTRVESVFCGLCRVSYLWFGFEFGKFSLKMPNFWIFFPKGKKNLFGSGQKVPR